MLIHLQINCCIIICREQDSFIETWNQKTCCVQDQSWLKLLILVLPEKPDHVLRTRIMSLPDGKIMIKIMCIIA